MKRKEYFKREKRFAGRGNREQQDTGTARGRVRMTDEEVEEGSKM